MSVSEVIAEYLNDDKLATIVGLLLSLIIIALSLDAPKWDARVVRRQTEHDAIRRLYRELYARRPTGPDVYRFVRLVGLSESIRRRQARLNARTAIAQELPEMDFRAGCSIALAWIDTVGEMALIAHRERRPLRRFMQTFHLGVIREALLALPFVACLYARGELTRKQITRAAAGIALMDLAAFYNSVARQQREAIFFKGDNELEPLGPIVNPPSRITLPSYAVLDRTMRSLRLPSWRVRAARRRLIKIAESLQRAATPPPSTYASRDQVG